ncbi:ABC transporter ATP-binding protein [Bacillus weihaiensis]|uniref:ABC transporter ATP-binding protein n=1 Tax=Bacillus weihaiensis TaxID=1547283 RepID=A0A1L3MVL3_9BACI|nr:ABC transporter ATP-binding protein [Bacillus weihaiensis]APH06378.1 ABC transporter ATP-binding protein [Bacillus weihaiensis]
MLHTFRTYLSPYRIAITVALTLMLTELAVELTLPLLMAKIIDEGILAKDLSVVIQWGSVMIGLSLLAFVCGIINSFYAAHVGQNFGFTIRKALFVKVQNFTFEKLNKFPTASLITRMTNDVTQLQNTIFMGLRIMLRAPLLLIGSIIMSFIVSPVLATVFLIAVPIVVILLITILKRGSKLFQLVQKKLDFVNDVLRENLVGMKLIKAYVRKEYERSRFNESADSLKITTIRALRIIESSMPILLFIMNVAILVLLWNGFWLADGSRIEVGEVVAVINYGLRTTAVLSMFSFIIMFISRSRASAERIYEVLHTEEQDLLHGKPSLFSQGDITFEHVTFSYPGEESVLKDISFSVHAGETVAIMGGTGAGKSSLMQLIPRLYEVDSGKISIDQVDISTMNLIDLRNQTGLVPQEAVLFTGSVKENIVWGKEDATMSEVVEAAKAAQIHETIEKLPQRYNTRIGQKGVNLSGGQKQRLSIARALVRKPKILLFDDSTSALDVHTEKDLMEALHEYSATMLIITHKISTAMQVDRVLLLDEGHLVAEGTHEQLLKTSPLYHKIYQSQMSEEVVYD